MTVLPKVLVPLLLLSVAIVSSEAFETASTRNQRQKLSLSAKPPSPTDDASILSTSSTFPHATTEKKKDNKAMAFLRKLGKIGGAANIDFRYAMGPDEGPSGKATSGKGMKVRSVLGTRCISVCGRKSSARVPPRIRKNGVKKSSLTLPRYTIGFEKDQRCLSILRRNGCGGRHVGR
jgi:hypothetical protein